MSDKAIQAWLSEALNADQERYLAEYGPPMKEPVKEPPTANAKQPKEADPDAPTWLRDLPTDPASVMNRITEHKLKQLEAKNDQRNR